MSIRIHSVSHLFSVQITASHVAIVVLVPHRPDRGVRRFRRSPTFQLRQCPVTCRGSAPTIPSPRDPLSRSFAMRRAIRALAALGLLAGAVVTAFAVAGPAAADT